MAQTIEQIEADLLAAKNADPVLSTINTPSKTGLWLLFVRTVAMAIFSLQKLLDAAKEEIRITIAALKPTTTSWYATVCKSFQFGFNLMETDQFDNTGKTEQQIADSKIVKHAACVPGVSPVVGSFLRIKIAKEVSNELAPLSAPELAAFKAYMERVGAAGDYLVIDSLVPDSLKMEWNIYYNPLILSATGARLDGSDPAPVRTAIKEYLKTLPFNGQYRPTFHIDFVQKTEGVSDPRIIRAEANYGLEPYTSINANYAPDAGYLRFYNDADLIINYIPYDV